MKITRNAKLNSKIVNANIDSINEEEKSNIKKHNIIDDLKESNVDNNDELAIILNVLEENIDILKEGKAKEELKALLAKRHSIKQSIKGE